MKKTYRIDRIPSFRYEMDLPTGLFANLHHKGEAKIYLNGHFVAWDNI